jgi:hypothetical protein
MSTALSIVPKQAIEQTTMSFVQERYQALDIADDPKELFRQAARLRKNIKRKRSLAATATPVGVISLAVGFGVLVFYLVPFTLDFFSLVLSCAFAAAGWRFLDFGFQSERRARYGKRGNQQSQYEIPDSDHFARVFEPVSAGDVQLVQVSISGAGSNFTPVTNQLIEKYVAGETAFADAWLSGPISSVTQSFTTVARARGSDSLSSCVSVPATTVQGRRTRDPGDAVPPPICRPQTHSDRARFAMRRARRGRHRAG